MCVVREGGALHSKSPSCACGGMMVGECSGIGRMDEKGYGRMRAGGLRLTQRCIYVLLKLQTLR